MFKKFTTFFRGSSPRSVTLKNDMSGSPCDHDLHLAVLVLLIEAAASDRDIPKEEAETVCELMQEQFGFSDDAIPHLIEEAVTIRREKGKLDEFIKTINTRFNSEQRQLIFAMIWKVLMADGQIDKFERKIGIQLQFRLNLDDDTANEARHLVEAGRV